MLQIDNVVSMEMVKHSQVPKKTSLQLEEKILQLPLCSIVMQNYWVDMLKNGRDLLDQGNLKSDVIHK